MNGRLAALLSANSKRYLLLYAALIAHCFIATATATEAPTFTTPDAAVKEVFALIDSRLALMRDVAAAKFRSKQAVVDEARERAVLEKTVEDAQAFGLDAQAARRLFDVQIRMARAVQMFWIERWQHDAQDFRKNEASNKNLSTELRPQLDAIGRELLLALYLDRAELSNATSKDLLSIEVHALHRHAGLDDGVLQDLQDALSNIKVTQPITTRMIQQAGVIRIGTTGDYAPFSDERHGRLFGFDITLAQSLANSLGVKLRLVKTSWPTLLDDLHAQHFDVAMSGITITADRAAQASFSAAYHIDGKTALARCQDSKMFATLDKIDRPQVRLIVNPGGTNQTFVNEHIKHAQVIVHADNRTIFDELTSQHADVMITDAIEADLQHMRHPELCRTTRRLFTRSEKALMMPLDSDLRTTVNRWLAPQLARRELQTMLRQSMRAALD